MSSAPKRSLFFRTGWAVPLLLGIIIGLLASYVPTLTPAATASRVAANCPQAKKTPVGANRYTPQPKKGTVKPLPHSTPVPPASGLRLGMIARPISVVRNIQNRANARDKRYMWYRVPYQVVRRTLPQYGFKPPIVVASPPKPVTTYSGRPVRKSEVKYRGRLWQVYLAQPAARGPKGIWVIVTILRQPLKLGMITRPLNVVRREQHLADTNKRYAWLRNPNQVVIKNLPQYGFVPRFKLVQPARTMNGARGRPAKRAVVLYQGTRYIVDVAQTAGTRRGSKGIWVIVTITPV